MKKNSIIIERIGDLLAIGLPINTIINIDDKRKFAINYIKNMSSVFLLKKIFRIPRPNDLTPHDTSDDLSFPSGHTSSAYYSVKYLLENKNISEKKLLIILSAYVGFSRIYANKHRLLDIFGSILLMELQI